jgi:hypothetical protein
MLAGGLLGCAPMDDMLSDSSNDGRNDRQMASAAQEACIDEVRDRGWTLVSVTDTDFSGVNDVDVSMRIQQPDGDQHDITCTYDGGEEDVRVNQG